MQPNDSVTQSCESPPINDETKMEQANLCNLPEELLSIIVVFSLQCDEDAGLPEFFILASTCRRIRQTCTGSASRIIWEVGDRSVTAFEDAILAVRATELVKAAFLSGDPPPELPPIPSLGRPAGNPTMQELATVLDLQHLVRCAEKAHLHINRKGPELRNAKSKRFHRSAYHIFIAGAMLSKAYHEPFFQEASAAKEDFMDAYLAEFDAAVACDEKSRDRSCSCKPSENTEDPSRWDYLKQFVVYDPEDFETGKLDRQAAVFDAFTEWTMQKADARAEKKTYKRLRGEPFNNTAISRIWTISQLIAAHDDILSSILMPQGFSYVKHRSHRYELPEHYMLPAPTRSATIVMFGSFSPAEITMPADVNVAEEGWWHVRKIGRAREHDPALLLDLVFKPLSIPPPERARAEGNPLPPSPLQLFEYMLRKYAGLRFKDKAWEPDSSFFGPFQSWLCHNPFFANRSKNGDYGMKMYQKL